MARMNTSIPMMGQNPDLMGAFDRGQQAGARGNAIQQQNALAGLYQTQGAGIAAGEQTALNALAAIDPMASLGVQQARLGMDATRQGMRISEEQLALQRQNTGLRMSELARGLAGDQRAAASEEYNRAAAMLTQAQTPEQFQMIISQPGFADAAANLGIGPEMLTFDNRDLLVASALGAKDALAMGDDGAPMTLIGKINADVRAGRISPEDAQMELQRAAPRGTSIEVGPDGTFRFSEGAGVVAGGGMGVKPGTAPQGYSIINDPDVPGGVRMIPTPGGPAEREIEAAGQMSGERAAQEQKYGRIVLEDIGRVLEAVEARPGLIAGPIGAVLSMLSGTDAHDVSKLLGTIRANVGFDRLQAMRSASPTGGALGAVSDAENKMLQATLGALEQSQSPTQFAQNLRRMQNLYTEIVHGPAPDGVSDDEWTRRAWSQGGDAQPAQANPNDVRPRLGTVEDGFRYRGGDPANPASWEQVQ